MLIARRTLPSLCAALLSLSLLTLLLASAAQAGEPANVTVRVEGVNETLLPSTEVTTTVAPVVNDGNAQDACAGTSALGALQVATAGKWEGPWSAKYEQYSIYSILGESHVFEESAPANYYWSFWLNDKESEAGACEAELHSGDRVLFFPACYGEACPANPALPLGIEAPTSANVGESVGVTVSDYSSSGVASPVSGATITGAAQTATTAAGGHASVSFTAPGEYTLKASAPELVRTEATICVHNGNDGNCGTHAPAGAPTPVASSTAAVVSAPYKGAYALVASVTGLSEHHTYSAIDAPRLLAGAVAAHSPVASVSLELRRQYRGRCYSYEGIRERFVKARCGQGSEFKVSSDGTFSYLLPAKLAPGRYVLDVIAADTAGNTTALARGSTRTVFYVG